MGLLWFILGLILGLFCSWIIYGKDKEENHDWDDYDKPVDKEPIRLDEIPTLDRYDK